jgi:hypothetical protein
MALTLGIFGYYLLCKIYYLIEGNMAQYEVEIKVLLGEKEKADKFRSEINDRFEGLKLVDTNSQLNHYFV